MEPYLPILKTFVEGELPFAEFKIWFSANSEALQQALSRHDYLLLKHRFIDFLTESRQFP